MNLLGWAGLAAWGSAFGCLLAATTYVSAHPVVGFVGAFAILTVVVLVSAAGAAVSAWSRNAVILALLFAVGLAAAGHQLEGAPGALLIGAALVAGGGWLGAGLGRGVQEAAHLWPLVVVGVGADIWSVTTPQGFTHQVVVEGAAPAVLSLIVVSVPIPGIGLQPVLGVGDILFTGLLLGAAAKLELSLPRCAIGLAVGYGLTLLTLLVLQLPIPALPFIAVAAAVALGREAPVRLREMLLAAGFVLLMFGARFVI